MSTCPRQSSRKEDIMSVHERLPYAQIIITCSQQPHLVIDVGSALSFQQFPVDKIRRLVPIWAMWLAIRSGQLSSWSDWKGLAFNQRNRGTLFQRAKWLALSPVSGTGSRSD